MFVDFLCFGLLILLKNSSGIFVLPVSDFTGQAISIIFPADEKFPKYLYKNYKLKNTWKQLRNNLWLRS